MDAGLASVPAGEPSARLTSFLQERRLLLEIGALSLAVLILLVSTLPNLSNHPVLTDDEMWVLSASYRLAHDGVFGSEMFAGFFNADSHYYFNMPGHHFVVAAALKVFGYGIVQARLVGVAYAIATLLLTYLLARRIYGVFAGMLAVFLLLFLRLNMGFDTGLPLQEVAVNLRYDLAPLPFILGGLLLLLAPALSLRRVAAVGALFGIATLMQFYGAFAFPIALAYIALEALPVRRRLQLAGALIGVGALVGLPYGAYILSDYDDFQGQAGTIDRRADFTEPAFYWRNVTHEIPDRFLDPLAFRYVQYFSVFDVLERRPSVRIALLAGLPLALLYAGWRGLRGGSRGDRLLFLSLGGLILEYTLFESTKFYFYWILAVPFVCIGIGGVAARLLQPPKLDALRLALAGGTVAALLIIFAEGSAARIGGIRAASDEGDYNTIAADVRHYVPDGSRVVGSTSLWWGQRDLEYRSYFLFFYLTRKDAGPYKTTISSFLDSYDPEYVILTRLAVRELNDKLLPAHRDELWRYMELHSDLIAHVETPDVAEAYGFIDIWKMK